MKAQGEYKDLTTGVVWKRLLVFFLPIAAGTCIQQLYNAVDGLIVGRFVGTVALAAVGGSSSQIINLLIGFFVAVTAGASVVVAQRSQPVLRSWLPRSTAPGAEKMCGLPSETRSRFSQSWAFF